MGAVKEKFVSLLLAPALCASRLPARAASKEPERKP